MIFPAHFIITQNVALKFFIYLSQLKYTGIQAPI